MSYSEMKETLLAASARAAGKNKVHPFRPDLSPCPGDTFAPREFADLPAELLIVERDPRDVRRLRAVVLDDYPQIGSTDVEIPLGEPGRVAHIRCDRGAWLESCRLPVEDRTGTLPADTLAQIQEKCRSLEAGEPTPTLHEEEVDGDPEYRRWKDETLAFGLARLARPKATPSRWTRSLQVVAAAAVVLAVGTFSVLHLQELQQHIENQSAKVAELEESRRDLEEKLTATDRGLEEVEAQLSRREEELAQRDQQVAALEGRVKALDAQAVEANAPFAYLTFGDRAVRAVEHTLLIPEGATRVTLVLEVVDAEPYASYSLHLTDQQSGEVVRTLEGLQRVGGIVSLSLPASDLPSGDYNAYLSGHGDDGTVTQLDWRYLLHVRRPGEW